MYRGAAPPIVGIRPPLFAVTALRKCLGMGFLEQVKKGDAGAAPTPDSSPQPVQQDFTRLAHARLKAVHDYLGKFCERLNRSQDMVLTQFDLPGFGVLSGLRQQAYVVQVDNPELVRKCTFRFDCRRNRTVEFTMSNKEAGERQQQYMWKHKLQFSSKKANDGQWCFRLDSCVPVWFEFEVDEDKQVVCLRSVNMDGFGVTTHNYRIQDITQEFVNEFAKYVVRKPNLFHQLSGDTISEDVRLRFKEQLARRKNERAKELDRVGGGKASAGRKKWLKGFFS